MQRKIYALLSILLLTTSVAVSQPSYSKTPAYNASDSEVNTKPRYHYYPNLQAYFDTTTNLYMYKVSNQWVSSEELPEFYGGYSLFNKYKVDINDYDGDDVTALLPLHKVKYPYNSKGRIKDENAKR